MKADSDSSMPRLTFIKYVFGTISYYKLLNISFKL